MPGALVYVVHFESNPIYWPSSMQKNDKRHVDDVPKIHFISFYPIERGLKIIRVHAVNIHIHMYDNYHLFHASGSC